MDRERIRIDVLTVLRANADAKGEVRGLRVGDIAGLAHRSTGDVCYSLNRLIAAGELAKIRRGNNDGPAVYRLGGITDEPPPFRTSIESVSRLVPNIPAWSTNFSFTAVSLPRLRCLENSGVVE